MSTSDPYLRQRARDLLDEIERGLSAVPVTPALERFADCVRPFQNVRDSVKEAADCLTAIKFAPQASRLRDLHEVAAATLNRIACCQLAKENPKYAEAVKKREGPYPTPGKDDVEQRDIMGFHWGIFTTEVRQVQKVASEVAKLLTSSSNFVPEPSRGQGGEAASPVPKEVAGWRRVWRWICSTTAAAYRITIEAGCSTLLEKLSGR